MKLYLGRNGYEGLIGSISSSNNQIFEGSPGNYVVVTSNGIRSSPFTLHNNVGETKIINLSVNSYTDGKVLSLEQHESSKDTIYHDRDEEDEACFQEVEDFDGGNRDDYIDNNGRHSERFLEHLKRRITELVCSDANFGGELTKEILDYFETDRNVFCKAGVEDEFFQPLEGSPTDYYTTYPNHLPADEYEKLKHDINTSLDYVKEGGGGLNADVFAHTKGFVVYFSRAGILELGKDPRSAILMSIARSALPESNWFIMNVLNVPPHNETEEEGEEYKKNPVGWHKDMKDFCKNDICASFTARAVQVLYVSVPSNMEGGELVFQVENMDSEEHLVTPQNGMLVKFDGRLLHSVNPFSSPSNEHRISLVLESYVLPPSWLETVPDLEFL